MGFDLGGLIGKLPGRMAPILQVITNFFVWASMFLCLVSYLIVIHDSAHTVLRDQIQGTLFDSRLVLVSLAAIVVLPLCFLNQRLLEKTSSIAVAINVYVFIFIFVLFCRKAIDDDLPQNTCLLGMTVRGNFSMASVMFQAVIIQMCVLPMYEELEDRSPRKFDKIVAVGFGTLFILFCGFSAVNYMLFGESVPSNVLQSLPSNGWSTIARIGVMFVVAFVYPIMVYPMIAPLTASTSGFIANRRHSVAVVAKIAITACALVTAVSIRTLGLVNVLDGAMSAAIFVALVPSIIGWHLMDSSRYYKAALICLLVGGLAISFTGLFFTDNYVGDLKCYLEV